MKYWLISWKNKNSDETGTYKADYATKDEAIIVFNFLWGDERTIIDVKLMIEK